MKHFKSTESAVDRQLQMTNEADEQIGDQALADLNFATALAAEAGQLALASFGYSHARRKWDGTLVTETDEAVDRFLTEAIANAYPDDAVLSEEAITRYSPATERTWVLDPLDGTTNFARGVPIWGVSIGLLVRGAPSIGVLNFPALNESYAARAGHGATRNGLAISTMPASFGLGDDQLFLECTRTRRAFTMTLPFKRRILGSAAYHICKVAEGSAVGGIETTPKIWDIGAAALILLEAGGVITRLEPDMPPIFPLDAVASEFGRRSMPLLHAANADFAQRMFAAIQRPNGASA